MGNLLNVILVILIGAVVTTSIDRIIGVRLEKCNAVAQIIHVMSYVCWGYVLGQVIH